MLKWKNKQRIKKKSQNKKLILILKKLINKKLKKSFIQNDPAEKLLNFLANNNERSQNYQTEHMLRMLEINNAIHYNQPHSKQIFKNAYYKDRHRCLFHRGTMLPNLDC